MTTPTTANKGRGSFAAMYETSRQMSHDANARQLRLAQIEPNADQPRSQFHPETLEELATSIKTYGVLQPLIVRPHPNGQPGQYQLIAGERRYRASRLAGLDAVPVVIKSLDDQKAREIALIENLQRENISPLEEAAVLKQILDETQWSHRELGERIGKTKAYVEQRVRLLRYPVEIQAALAASPLDGPSGFSPGHAKAVVQLEDASERQALITLVEQHGLSVREAERRVHQLRQLRELGPSDRLGKLSQSILTPQGLSDAAYAAGLTGTPGKPAAAAPAGPVDVRTLGLYALVREAEASGRFELDAATLVQALKADLARLR